MVRNPPYLTTFPNKSHKGTTFYKTAGEKADKKWDCPGAECHLYYQRLRAEVAFSPLSQICVHFHANVCAFSRKRLCIFTQTFALAVSNVCIGGFKRLHWRFQTFASVVSNVCVQIGQKSGMGVCPVHSGQIGAEAGCCFLFLSYRQAFSRFPHCS